MEGIFQDDVQDGVRGLNYFHGVNYRRRDHFFAWCRYYEGIFQSGNKLHSGQKRPVGAVAVRAERRVGRRIFKRVAGLGAGACNPKRTLHCLLYMCPTDRDDVQ